MQAYGRLFHRLFGSATKEKPFHSQFGGLWTDRVDAREEAERRYQSGSLNREDFDDLVSFITEGYLILPRAVDANLARSVIDDVETAVRNGDRLMTYWDADGHHKEAGSIENLHKAEAKVLDVHASIASVREAIFSENPALSGEHFPDATRRFPDALLPPRLGAGLSPGHRLRLRGQTAALRRIVDRPGRYRGGLGRTAILPRQSPVARPALPGKWNKGPATH